MNFDIKMNPNFDPSHERAAIAETLLSSAARLIQARNELEIIKGICEALCATSHHIQLAWTWSGDVSAPVIRPQVYAGAASEYAAQLVIERNFLTEFGPAFSVLKGQKSKSFKISSWSAFGPWRDASKTFGTKSALAVPLVTSIPENSGIFVLYADDERYFEDVGEGLFVALGALFSSVLNSAAEMQSLKQAINNDALTGALNRHALPIVERRIARHSLYDPKAFVFLIDIDHFKSVNDQHGHLVGDTVLRHTAKTMRTSLRRDDDLLRWGGEEFLVCLSNTGFNEAMIVAEKLRAAIEAQTQSPRVTVSIGVAEVMPQRPLTHSIQIADQALFDAKKSGRNRVCVKV